MILKKTLIAAAALSLQLSTFVASQNPPCYICDDDPDATIDNPDGVVPLPADLAEQFGLAEVPCSLIYNAGRNGLIPEADCLTDDPDADALQEFCGCSNFVAPTDPPVVVPVDVPTESPVVVPVDVPTDPPVDVPTEPPVDVPMDAPSESPKDVPVDVPIESPMQKEVDKEKGGKGGKGCRGLRQDDDDNDDDDGDDEGADDGEVGDDDGEEGDDDDDGEGDDSVDGGVDGIGR